MINIDDQTIILSADVNYAADGRITYTDMNEVIHVHNKLNENDKTYWNNQTTGVISMQLK